MTQEELDTYKARYLLDVLTFEEYRSMGIDNFRRYAKEHVVPIPKEELVVGQEYPGHCRNANKATWDGEVFHYKGYECGFWVDETIRHFEDDAEDGIDVFVPVKEV